MTIRQDMLRAKAREVAPDLEQASAVAAKAAAENRNMTRDERATYDAAMAKAAPVLAGLRAARSDASVEAYARGIFDGGPAGKAGKRLSFKGMAAGIGDKMLTGEFGQKSLAPSGATVVTQGFVEDPVALGRVANGLLDVLPVEVHGTSQYARLIQGTRTNLAAIVDDGDEKPESVIGLTRVEKSLKVIATLSEPTNRFWLIDNSSLEIFIANELSGNVTRAVETMVLTDIAGTSGIQVQGYSTSPLQTLRKCITKLEIAGHQAAAIVLHPTDWEGVELALSSTAAIEHLSLPYDPATRRLFGCPVAVTVSATAGLGHVVAQDAVVVDTDTTGLSVQWSENVGDSFKFNNLVCRVELRAGTSVLAPLGVVSADLTA
jgi:HK97 family phage major capsid protein